MNQRDALFLNRRLIRVLVFVLAVSVCALCTAGPLEDYVNAPDANYTFSLANTIKGIGYTAYVLDMTSQSWKAGEATPALWRHWVTIIRPDTVNFDTALLLVSGGSNKHDKPPGSVETMLSLFAVQTRSVVVNLQGIPSEPLKFSDEDRTRSEDQIIAYTFNKYLETGDGTWPVLCPMVKSAVRAMDATQTFLGEQASPPQRIDKFVVAGASKRGWTTWLTAVVDDRVTAIAPIVIDMLRLDKQMVQQMAYYGAYTEAIQDYTDFGIQDRMNTKRGQALLKIVDPYAYRDKLTLPKLLLYGAGDQYWTIDSANLYYPGLKGVKYLRYEPNAEHGIDNSQPTVMAVANFYYSILNGSPLPEFSWDFKSNGDFRVVSKTSAKAAKLWTAQAPTMDFRLRTIGPVWSSQPIADQGGGVFEGHVSKPEEGYAAYFVEMTYPGPLGMDYSLTTQMGIPGKRQPNPVSGLLRLGIPLVILAGIIVFIIKR